MKTLRIFRNEDEGGAGGGGESQVPQGSFAASLMDDGPAEQPLTPQTPPAQTPPASPMVDAAALAREFGQVLSKQQGQQQPQAQQRQMTREEARKALGFMEIDDNFLAKFDNLETKKQALADMYENIMSVATNITRAQAEELRQHFSQQLEPATRFISEYEAKQKESRFNEKYPVLAKKEYGPIIGSIVGHLRQQNALTGDEEKDFELIAKNMTAVLQQSNPNFQLTSGAPAKPNGSIPNVSSGSGGGAATPRGGAKNPSGSKAVALLS